MGKDVYILEKRFFLPEGRGQRTAGLQHRESGDGVNFILIDLSSSPFAVELEQGGGRSLVGVRVYIPLLHHTYSITLRGVTNLSSRKPPPDESEYVGPQPIQLHLVTGRLKG